MTSHQAYGRQIKVPLEAPAVLETQMREVPNV
jgi:hypothetical protein